MQRGDLHTRGPQSTEAFHLVIKLCSLCSQICSIKDSTKGTYVWLFASVASSLYVNGEKSTLYKGLSFSGRQRLVTSLGRVSLSAGSCFGGGSRDDAGQKERWNIYANCCKTSHKRRQEACDEELSSSAVRMTSLKPTEEQKSKARAHSARVPDGARRRSEPL